MFSVLIPALLLGASNGISFESCQIGPENGPKIAAECGWLEVPENHAEPAGRQIRLRIAKLKARSAKPAPEPLVFIAGGPGQSAVESFPAVSGAFQGVQQQRDILLIDQRGTGESHPLKCPALDEESTGWDEPEPGVLTQWTRDCLAQLEGDPRFYTTIDAVADLEFVREKLAYPAYALYGISYGTRVAIEYLRQHDDKVVATVLDGVVPPTETLGTEIASDAQRALDILLDRCSHSESCSKAFPELRNDFVAVRTKLEAGSLTVTVRHPNTGEWMETEMSWPRFAMLLRMFSYTPEGVSVLPAIIHQAADGDWAAAAGSSLGQQESMEDMINIGMHNAVVCNEDLPFYSEASDAESDDYLGMMTIEGLQIMCEIWPKREVPPSFKSALETDTPVLLLSGAADPVTPPENGSKVAAGPRNALHLIAEGQGHGIAWRGCMPRVLARFYKSPEPRNLDTACIQDFKADPFFIDRNGPALGEKNHD